MEGCDGLSAHENIDLTESRLGQLNAERRLFF
jgi:hypothetical protein